MINKYEALDNFVGESMTYRRICEITHQERKTGKSKICQIKDIERFYEIEKNGVNYNILKKIEKPKSKKEVSRKELKGYAVPFEKDNGTGIYCIVTKDKRIYIGSTTTGFRQRFHIHKGGYQELTSRILEDGGLFQVLEVLDHIDDEKIIRTIENEWIEFFLKSDEWNCVNKNKAICVSRTETKEKRV